MSTTESTGSPRKGAVDVDAISRRIVAEAADAIVYADAEGRIRLWNAGAEAIFGWSAEEAVGQSLDLIIPEKQRKPHWDGYRRVMETGVSRYGAGDLLKVPASKKDGTRVSVEFTVVMVRGEDGRLAGIAAILRDVTARWNEERALRARLRELETKAG